MTNSNHTLSEEPAHLQISRREVIVGLAVVAACSGEDDAASGESLEVKAPYPSWTTTLSNGYWRTTPDGTQTRYVTSNAGTTTVKGKTFQRFRMAREGGAATTGAELWVSRAEGARVTFAGGSYTSETVTKLGLVGSASVTLDEPITVDPDAPVNKPQPFDLKGKVTVGSTSTAASASGTYTVVERGVTVETSAGPVSGCNHVRIEGKVPILFGTAEVSASGEVWYSPSLGVVKAKFDEPIEGFGAGINGSRGWHDLGNGYASVEAVGVVGGGTNRFELSTSEAPDEADKTVHAKMLLELRWVDESAAKTSQRPSVTEEMGTWVGYFPEQLVQSPVSLLHPEENDKGYVYWIAYVDQAAKNEAGSNATRYHTRVTCDASLSPVRVSSRIIFKRFVESSGASTP